MLKSIFYHRGAASTELYLTLMSVKIEVKMLDVYLKCDEVKRRDLGIALRGSVPWHVNFDKCLPER
jgi:hypothetical protein